MTALSCRRRASQAAGLESIGFAHNRTIVCTGFGPHLSWCRVRDASPCRKWQAIRARVAAEHRVGWRAVLSTGALGMEDQWAAVRRRAKASFPGRRAIASQNKENTRYLGPADSGRGF